jgi:hypothetical protein
VPGGIFVKNGFVDFLSAPVPRREDTPVFDECAVLMVRLEYQRDAIPFPGIHGEVNIPAEDVGKGIDQFGTFSAIYQRFVQGRGDLRADAPHVRVQRDFFFDCGKPARLPFDYHHLLHIGMVLESPNRPGGVARETIGVSGMRAFQIEHWFERADQLVDLTVEHAVSPKGKINGFSAPQGVRVRPADDLFSLIFNYEYRLGGFFPRRSPIAPSGEIEGQNKEDRGKEQECPQKFLFRRRTVHKVAGCGCEVIALCG